MTPSRIMTLPGGSNWLNRAPRLAARLVGRIKSNQWRLTSAASAAGVLAVSVTLSARGGPLPGVGLGAMTSLVAIGTSAIGVRWSRTPNAPQTRNLVAQAPATLDRPSLTRQTRWVWATAAIVGVGAVLCAVGAPLWAYVVLVLGLAASAVVGSLPAYRWHQANSTVFGALTSYRPSFVMPYAGTGVFHVAMWEPYLGRSGERHIVVTLHARTLDRLAAATTAPVILLDEHTTEAARTVLPASIKAAFYVHNGKLNDIFLRIRSVKHVFLHHGDGDKPASYSRRGGVYDILVVSGQAAIDRYHNHGVQIPLEKFVICGRPQTETIDIIDNQIAKIDHPSVLYAPTWHGFEANKNLSSLPFGDKIIAELLRRQATVIFRPHPVSRNHPGPRKLIERIEAMLDADTAATGRQHIHGHQAEKEWGVSEVANASDAMIADVSGIVTDYLHSGKPYAMVSTTLGTADFKREYPTAQGSYVIAVTEPDSLQSAIGDLLGSDPLHDLRWERRRHYLGDFEGPDGAARAFAAYLRTLV